jgi:tetratricopeptide (TPR) repeat protein
MQSKKITENMILQIEIHIKCGELEEAKKKINETIKICKDFELTESYGKCNLLLANINLKKEEYNEAVTNFEKALYFFIKNEDKENIFKCYVGIGKIYMQEEFYKGAVSYFKFAEEISEEGIVKDIDTYKELYSKMAHCYIKMDEPQKSLDYIEKVDKLDDRNREKQEIEMLVMKANNLFNINKYDESKENFKKALEIIEREDNRSALAEIYLTICNIYTKMGHNDKVLEYSQKVYDIKKHDEDEYMMDGLVKIIEAHIEDEEFDLATRYCKLALASSIKLKNKFYEYKALKFYADIHKGQNEINLAIEYLKKCIHIISNLNESKILANLYIDLGQLYSNISKEKELEYYQKGVFMYKNLQII